MTEPWLYSYSVEMRSSKAGQDLPNDDQPGDRVERAECGKEASLLGASVDAQEHSLLGQLASYGLLCVLACML